MSDNEPIVEATADNFDAVVIDASRRAPVLVDFWADWCQPCRMLGPVLETLAVAYQGKLTIAKVDTEAEQELALRFGVRSLPTVKLFFDGTVVDEFTGVKPEGAIRGFLDRHVPRESDGARGKAASLRADGEWQQAISVLEDAAAADPENPRIKPDLLRSLIDAEQYERASVVLDSVPINLRLEKPYVDFQVKLRAGQRASGSVREDAQGLEEAIANDPANLEKRLTLAAKLTLGGEPRAALEQYLEIMRRDRKFQDDAGRKGLVEMFQLLGDTDPLVAEFRRRMAALLH